MAFGGSEPKLASPKHDIFSADGICEEWDDKDEGLLRVYGATGGSTPLQLAKEPSEVSVDDIPLYEFQLDSYKDPLIQNQNSKTPGRKSNPVQKLLSLHSMDSSSSMTNISALSYNQYDSWINHPKVRENCQLVLGSGFLMVLGIVLICVGLGIAVSPATGYHCIVIIVIGILCLIPGGYHFIYIYCAAIGRPGFHFNNLPVLR